MEEACKHASAWRFATFIVPRCVHDQLDLALTHLMTRGLWWCVGGVLERGVSDTRRRWVVKEASERIDNSDFNYFTLPFCKEEHLAVVLPGLVKHAQWRLVRHLPHDFVSDTLYEWIQADADRNRPPCSILEIDARLSC